MLKFLVLLMWMHTTEYRDKTYM